MFSHLEDNKLRNQIGIDLFIRATIKSGKPAEVRAMNYLSCYEETPPYLKEYLLKAITTQDDEAYSLIDSTLQRAVTINTMEKIVKDYDYSIDKPEKATRSVDSLDAFMELLNRKDD